ncbi:MAG: hypothetical protein V1773_05980 [bacterium]
MIYHFIIIFIVLNVIIDGLGFWFESGGVLAYIRLIIIIVPFIYLILKREITWKLNIPIFLFCLYVFLQLYFAENFLYSARLSLQVTVPLLTFYMGFAVIKRFEDFKKYIRQLFYVYMFIVVYSAISLIFSLGTSDYTKGGDFTLGNFRDSYNLFTYSIFLFPLYFSYETSKIKKILSILFLCVLIILVVISLKRISIIGLLIGFLFYLYYYGINTKSLSKLFKLSIIPLMLLVLSYPFYKELLMNRIETRESTGRFNTDFYESELRYIETFLLLEKISSFKNPTEVIFGLKAFDSRGAFNGLLGDKRMVHIDYNLITYTIGLFGLLLYLTIYLSIWRRYGSLKKSITNVTDKKIIIIVPVLFFSSILTSFAGQMYLITFRMIIFMTIGVVFKIIFINNQKNKNELNYESINNHSIC